LPESGKATLFYIKKKPEETRGGSTNSKGGSKRIMGQRTSGSTRVGKGTGAMVIVSGRALQDLWEKSRQAYKHGMKGPVNSAISTKGALGL